MIGPWGFVLAGALAGALAPLGMMSSDRASGPIRWPWVWLAACAGAVWGLLCLAFLGGQDRSAPVPTLGAVVAFGPMLLIALVDLRDQVVHDWATGTLAASLLVWRWGLDGLPWMALLGAGLAFLGADLLRRLHARLRGYAGLGTGDLGLFAASGVALTWGTLPLFLMVAGGLGVVTGLVLGRRRAGIPFAPALMGALALAVLLHPFGGWLIGAK